MAATADKTETPSPPPPPPTCNESGCKEKPTWETSRKDYSWGGRKRWCDDHFQDKLGRYPLEDIKRVEGTT